MSGFYNKTRTLGVWYLGVWEVNERLNSLSSEHVHAYAGQKSSMKIE